MRRAARAADERIEADLATTQGRLGILKHWKRKVEASSAGAIAKSQAIARLVAVSRAETGKTEIETQPDNDELLSLATPEQQLALTEMRKLVTVTEDEINFSALNLEQLERLKSIVKDLKRRRVGLPPEVVASPRINERAARTAGTAPRLNSTITTPHDSPVVHGDDQRVRVRVRVDDVDQCIDDESHELPALDVRPVRRGWSPWDGSDDDDVVINRRIF